MLAGGAAASGAAAATTPYDALALLLSPQRPAQQQSRPRVATRLLLQEGGQGQGVTAPAAAAAPTISSRNKQRPRVASNTSSNGNGSSGKPVGVMGAAELKTAVGAAAGDVDEWLGAVEGEIGSGGGGGLFCRGSKVSEYVFWMCVHIYIYSTNHKNQPNRRRPRS
jgi:hypothetical protein